MNVTEILAKFPNAKPNGKGWTAKCPSHNDHNPSLSISEGEAGRVLLCCHAGCPVENICAAVGLTVKDLFNGNGERNGSTPRKIVATYDYKDADGTLQHQTVRYVPKDFAQRRPDKSAVGGWCWNLRGVKRVLFRLPEVTKDIKRGLRVILAEGERDVLALVDRGFTATCNPCGAKKWQDSYTATLTGADCIIIADKDEAGREHAQLVAGKLHGKAKSVRVIELPDVNGKPVKDAADYFNAGGDAAGLNALIDTAPEWKPADVSPKAKHELTLAQRLSLVRYSPDVEPPKAKQVFFIGSNPVSTAGNITTISAKVKAGKTAVVEAMIASTFAAVGADCLGFRSSNPDGRAVIHFDTEQSPYDHWQLVQRVKARAMLTELSPWVFSYCLTGWNATDIRAAIRPALKTAKEQCGGVLALMIDGVADAAIDVNDPKESNAFVAELHALAIEFDCSIVVVIHVNPASETHKTRGHLGSQLERKGESNLQLEKAADETITLWADKNRRAPISKSTGPRFAWNTQTGMHTSLESQQAANENRERLEAVETFKPLFDQHPLMTFTELRTTVMETVTVAARTAERKIKTAVMLGVIKKTFGNRYEYKG